MRIRYTTQARDDLVEIHSYIANENRVAAAKVIRTIREQIRILVDHPHIGRRGQIDGTRELIISHYPYILAYRVIGETIEIVTVWHTARDYP